MGLLAEGPIEILGRADRTLADAQTVLARVEDTFTKTETTLDAVGAASATAVAILERSATTFAAVDDRLGEITVPCRDAVAAQEWTTTLLAEWAAARLVAAPQDRVESPVEHADPRDREPAHLRAVRR